MENNTAVKSFYEMLGEEKIRQLVFHFYELVYADPTISHLFTNDIEEVRDKQFRFLCQFLGGPAYYIEKYGPPRMRQRHLPHPIDQQAKDAWLSCMKTAISKLDLHPHLAQSLYDCFPKLANHMVNK